MSKPPKPDFLVQYEEWVKAGPPKCCHTCEYYLDNGACYRFKMEPPDAFVNSVDQCSEWEQETPF